MTSVRSANGRDAAGVPRRRKPIMNRRSDLAALHWRLARPVVTGDQQKNAITPLDGGIEAAVDGAPGAVQVHPVEIKYAVGFDDA